MRQALVGSALLAALLLLLTTPAHSGPGDQVGYRGWGPRIGLSSGPDQVHFGAHMDFGYFADRWRLQPNLEVGVGSDRTLTAFNLETSYRFQSAWGAWSPYAGGGIGLDMIGGNDRLDRSNDELGANILGGIETEISNGDRFFLETKLAMAHEPDLKITAGWTFY